MNAARILSGHLRGMEPPKPKRIKAKGNDEVDRARVSRVVSEVLGARSVLLLGDEASNG